MGAHYASSEIRDANDDRTAGAVTDAAIRSPRSIHASEPSPGRSARARGRRDDGGDCPAGSAAAVVFDERANRAVDAAVDAGVAPRARRREWRVDVGAVVIASDGDRGAWSRSVCASGDAAPDRAHEWRAAPDRRHRAASLCCELCRSLLAWGFSDPGLCNLRLVVRAAE